jgi:drug/metabolite transporter (DMT)-like permease
VPASVTTTGPLLWVLFAIGVLTCLSGLYLVVDPVRRGPEAFARIPETRWPYVAVGTVFVIAYGAWWFAAVRVSLTWVGDVVLAGMPVVVAATAAYLLRVVYPKVQAAPSPGLRTTDPEKDTDRPEELHR